MGRDAHHRALGCRVERVAEQVVEHLLETSRLAAHADVRDVSGQLDAPFGGDRRPGVEARFDDGSEGDVHARRGGVLGPGEDEEALHELGEAGHLGERAVEVLASVARAVGLDVLEPEAQRRERGAQLV